MRDGHPNFRDWSDPIPLLLRLTALKLLCNEPSAAVSFQQHRMAYFENVAHSNLELSLGPNRSNVVKESFQTQKRLGM